MILEHVVIGHVAALVEPHAVDRDRVERHDRVCDLVRLDELEVELHAAESAVGRHERERFAVDRSGHPHRAEFAGEINRECPIVIRQLHLADGRRIDVGAEIELQAGAGADEIGREGRKHPR